MKKDYLYFNDITKVIDQDYIVEGNPNVFKVNKINTLEEAGEFSLIWIKSGKTNKEEIIKNTKARAIICDRTVSLNNKLLKGLENDKCLIKVAEPKYAVIRVIEEYFRKEYERGIHKSAVIDAWAKINDDVCIGPQVYVGAAEIGKGVVIEGNVFIYDNVVIRDNVTVQAGAVIGSGGFGHFKDKDKKLIPFPHIGRVVLDKDTQIGSNAVINRGTLGETYLGCGSKVNKLCVVSHNVIIGKHNFIASLVCINGSAKIGDNNYIGAGANIRNKVVIGNNTVVGMGAVVVDYVPDNIMVYGNPAKKVNRSPNKSLY